MRVIFYTDGLLKSKCVNFELYAFVASRACRATLKFAQRFRPMSRVR